MISIAHAQEAASQATAAASAIGPGTHQLIMIAMIVGVFYFLLIRPQQKQQKMLKQMVSDAKKGDEVLLSSGMYGKIAEVKDDNTVLVQVANNVVIKFDRNSIQNIKGYDPKKKAA